MNRLSTDLEYTGTKKRFLKFRLIYFQEKVILRFL